VPELDEVVAGAGDEAHVGGEGAGGDGLGVEAGEEGEEGAGLPAPDEDVGAAAAQAAVALLVGEEAAHPGGALLAVAGAVRRAAARPGPLDAPLRPGEDVVLVAAEAGAEADALPHLAALARHDLRGGRHVAGGEEGKGRRSTFMMPSAKAIHISARRAWRAAQRKCRWWRVWIPMRFSFWS
jgi:hypothetical protein